MSSSVLTDKDINVYGAAAPQPEDAKADIKSMEYHRQILQSKMEEQGKQTYVSPSDSILSPCTAKLQAQRSKNAGKVKGRTLFTQAVTGNNANATDAKKIEGV